MKYKTEIVTEGSTKLKVPIGFKLDSKMPVFFNPVMKLNRDLTVLFVKAIKKPEMEILDLMTASGAKGLRLAKEANVKVHLNDYNPNSIPLIKTNTKLNDLQDSIEITQKEANHLLTEPKKWYDFIDIDPFGTPISFLDNAIKATRYRGFLAVTATDTSALCGTYPKACERKYLSKPLRNGFMYETAVRILIKHIQELAVRYDLAFTPVFVHGSDHYTRVYMKREDGAQKAQKILKNHGYILFCPNCLDRKVQLTLKDFNIRCKCKEEYSIGGPLWLGPLWDKDVVSKMIKFEDMPLLQTIKAETEIEAPWFFDVHKVAKKHKFSIPKYEKIISGLKKKGFKATRTHFSEKGIKTDASIKDVIKVMKN